MSYYYIHIDITISFILHVIILTHGQDTKKIYRKHPATQGIGNVLDTRYGVSSITCAVSSCMTAGVCTSCNMMSMEDGKYCQLLEAIKGTLTNPNSTMYGKII